MSTPNEAARTTGPDHTEVSTRRADEADSNAGHGADRMPTEAEDAIADEQAASQPDGAGEHFREMAEIGAEIDGEGSIDGPGSSGLNRAVG